MEKESKKTVKKAVIPIAGLGTRFLPLSKVLPKELFPLAAVPMLQYILKEVADSGITEVIFVNRREKKIILEYLKKKITSKKVFQARFKHHFLKDFEELENLLKTVSFSEVFQKNPLGDGDAILQAKNSVKNEPCAVLFADDIIDSKKPAISQLIKVFEKYRKPVIALYRVPPKSFQFYGMAQVEKIENKVYRIKKIVEKPKKFSSNLAIVGKYVFTPEVFKWLEKTPYNQKGELIAADALAKAIAKGKEVLGCELDGKWLECGNKEAYLKSNIYLSLKHPQFGKELKKFLKEIEE